MQILKKWKQKHTKTDLYKITLRKRLRFSINNFNSLKRYFSLWVTQGGYSDIFIHT